MPSWHLAPGYLDFLSAALEDALRALPAEAGAGAHVLFTAHSLPARILDEDDPYPAQLRETAAAVAARTGLERWSVAWQSAGRTPEPWIGPDVLEAMSELAAAGASAVVVCPAGFVADHLEVLYDLDVEAARAHGSWGSRSPEPPRRTPTRACWAPSRASSSTSWLGKRPQHDPTASRQ